MRLDGAARTWRDEGFAIVAALLSPTDLEKASPRRLAPFGFPPPGHPFWTPGVLTATALRYPGLDLTPWR